MKTVISFVLITLLSCCTIGNRGVFFNEMSERPQLILKENLLTVKTANSREYSALLIHAVHLSVDEAKKQIHLSAEQALNQDFKNTFVINLADFKISEPEKYSFFWIDPDENLTKLDF
ncbi:MAG: hypothetical protein V4642_14040 [Bacteroidota bacterium]